MPIKSDDMFTRICKSLKIEKPEPEHKFVKDRRWRIDYAWPSIKLGVELEGGIYTKGRHVRGKGYANDMEKYNRMAEEGWCLLRYEPTKIDWKQIERLYLLCKIAEDRINHLL